MKHILILVLLGLLAACQQDSADNNATAQTGEVVAVVNDEPVTTDLLKAYLRANGIAKTDEITLNKALEGLIAEMAMAREAQKKKLALTPEQLNTLQYLHLRAMAANALNDYLQAHPVEEKDLRAEYNKIVKNTGGQEYHVHHLLFADEVQAQKLAEEITAGKTTFAEAEKKYLAENSNRRNVGDLGWVNLSQLPKGFRQVLPTMNPGQTYPKAVASEYGGHVLFLEDTRQLQPPPFEEVKAGIERSLRQKQMDKYRQLARAKARVAIKE